MSDILDVAATAKRLLVGRQITARDYIYHFKDMDSGIEDIVYLRPDNQQMLTNNAAYIDKHYRVTALPDENVRMYERLGYEYPTPN